ncbi:MAG: MFS transporter [Nocardiopsaceae bacterium]|jgi:MFS family permease|nr:MFS transporter [Nocardiopsaceae bacterium]
MTQVRDRRGRERDTRTSQRQNSYLDLLRTPGALAFSSAGFVGRMSMSMYGLGTVLLIALLTGRYGEAGTVAAVGSVGYAVFGPVIATRADRLGQRKVLYVQTAVFTLGSAVFITCAELRAPFWTLLVTGVIAGGSMPSIGSMVRTRWSSLVGGEPRRLHTAFALESVNDELIFVIGPALVTVLATQLAPASGIGIASLLCIVGTILFASQRRTEPRPRPKPAPAVKAVPARARFSRPSLPAQGLITLAPAFLLLGAMFSGIDLSTVAFATDLGYRPLAGVILGIYALGSAAGGLWYGSRHWQAPVGRRFTVTAALAVLGVSTFWAMPGMLALAAVGFLAGLAISPTLMSGYAILERQSPPHRTTEAMAWLSSTISVGVALGSAFAGHIIDAYGARWSFAFSAGCGVAGVLICVAGLGKLRTDQDGQPAELAATS